MSSGRELANQARKSRTSIVFLILSVASIYYSTQVYLAHSNNWWIYAIAVAGVLFFVISMVLMWQDYQHESDYRDLLEREKRADVETKEAEVKQLQDERAEARKEGTPASIAGESEPLPKEQEKN